jgi:hypothetical protein
MGTEHPLNILAREEYEKVTGDSRPAVITGKPIAQGGSEGRGTATGLGAVYVLESYLKITNQAEKEITIALQGFGNAGLYFASSAHPNWKIVAASDSKSAIYTGDRRSPLQYKNMTKNNLRFPAEWEKHKSTILCWPHQKADWPGKFTPIPWVYVEIVKNIAPGELVRIIVQNDKEKNKVKPLPFSVV